MHLRDIINEIPKLSVQDRKQLMHILVDSLTSDEPKTQTRLLDYAGIGADLYDGTDAQDHVRQLRDEWDDRL